MAHHDAPDLMPVLSRGKHRSPRKGACFMELASYLAGERWSDHPRCTHPLLAELARTVNDHVADSTRARLAPLIPEVIGLTGDGPRVPAWIARDTALTALPIASAERQGLAAAALLRCEHHLARVEGRGERYLSPVTAAALDDVPHARAWAMNLAVTLPGPVGNFDQRAAQAIVRTSVSSIAAACAPETDSILVELLARTVGRCQVWFQASTTPVSEPRWVEVCALTR